MLEKVADNVKHIFPRYHDGVEAFLEGYDAYKGSNDGALSDACRLTNEHSKCTIYIAFFALHLNISCCFIVNILGYTMECCFVIVERIGSDTAVHRRFTDMVFKVQRFSGIGMPDPEGTCHAVFILLKENGQYSAVLYRGEWELDLVQEVEEHIDEGVVAGLNEEEATEELDASNVVHLFDASKVPGLTSLGDLFREGLHTHPKQCKRVK